MFLHFHYILNDHGEPVLEPDLLKWAAWFEAHYGHPSQEGNIRVACECVGYYEVSTVFLGLDHSFRPDNPVLWGTMVFGDGPLAGILTRCSGSREQAEAMHARMVDKLKAHLSKLTE